MPYPPPPHTLYQLSLVYFFLSPHSSLQAWTNKTGRARYLSPGCGTWQMALNVELMRNGSQPGAYDRNMINLSILVYTSSFLVDSELNNFNVRFLPFFSSFFIFFSFWDRASHYVAGVVDKAGLCPVDHMPLSRVLGLKTCFTMPYWFLPFWWR